MKIEHETVNGEQAVRVTFGHWSWTCVFLILWLTGWSIGCYGLASHLVTGPFKLEELLFALPFFVFEIGVSGIVAMMIFGRTTITFTRLGWTKFTGIGKLGITTRRAFPSQFEILTDSTITHGKHGATTHYNLLVKTPSDTEGMQIYSSTEEKRIAALYEIARGIAGGAAAPAERQEANVAAASEAETEHRERELLAGGPPKGMVVERDLEGRVFVTYRRVRWLLALVLVVAVSIFGAVIWQLRGKIPLPALIGFGLCFLFPLAQLAYALLGKWSLTLDHGSGATFVGIGGLGFRKSFRYGRASAIALRDSDRYINNERMAEIIIANPGEKQIRICTTWPNKVKPYLVALLRHPDSVAATMPQRGFS